MALISKIKQLSSAYLDEIIEIRRKIHENPELSFEEFKTGKYIQQKLTEYQIPFKSGYVKTGISAIIEGKNPKSKTIALRADIDALPILEKNKVEYCSKNAGIMHACGHDVHTASLLGTAKILNELKNEFEGTVQLIFQPGEEKLPGGASLLIKEGIFNDTQPKSIFGQHVFPELEAGKVGFRPGMYMASTDEIYVTVKGKGGHGALPHTLVDPVLIASHLVVALQQLVSRQAKPEVPTVLSFGKVTANGATNVIPNEVRLEGTFRTMDETWREDAHQKMVKLATSIAEGMGGSCDFEIRKGYPFLTNDIELTNRAIAHAEAFLGKENVVELDLRMTAEDFAYYSQILPACFYRLGVRNETKGIISQVHTDTFDIDESALKTSIGLMCWLTINELQIDNQN